MNLPIRCLKATEGGDSGIRCIAVDRIAGVGPWTS
jgi:hypothetical protein